MKKIGFTWVGATTWKPKHQQNPTSSITLHVWIFIYSYLEYNKCKKLFISSFLSCSFHILRFDQIGKYPWIFSDISSKSFKHLVTTRIFTRPCKVSVSFAQTGLQCEEKMWCEYYLLAIGNILCGLKVLVSCPEQQKE